VIEGNTSDTRQTFNLNC